MLHSDGHLTTQDLEAAPTVLDFYDPARVYMLHPAGNARLSAPVGHTWMNILKAHGWQAVSYAQWCAADRTWGGRDGR